MTIGISQPRIVSQTGLCCRHIHFSVPLTAYKGWLYTAALPAVTKVEGAFDESLYAGQTNYFWEPSFFGIFSQNVSGSSEIHIPWPILAIWYVTQSQLGAPVVTKTVWGCGDLLYRTSPCVMVILVQDFNCVSWSYWLRLLSWSCCVAIFLSQLSLIMYVHGKLMLVSDCVWHYILGEICYVVQMVIAIVTSLYCAHNIQTSLPTS